jgi:hypothetical protein
VSGYFLAQYARNPFALDLSRSEQVRAKLRLAYYPFVVSTLLIPVFVGFVAADTRRRALFSALGAVPAALLVVWATRSALELWAELGGKGLP